MKKPEMKPAVHQSGITSRKDAFSILHDFYMEAKKEIRKATTAVRHDSAEYASLTFTCDGFSLELNFTEGRTAV